MNLENGGLWLSAVVDDPHFRSRINKENWICPFSLHIFTNPMWLSQYHKVHACSIKIITSNLSVFKSFFTRGTCSSPVLREEYWWQRLAAVTNHVINLPGERPDSRPPAKLTPGNHFIICISFWPLHRCNWERLSCHSNPPPPHPPLSSLDQGEDMFTKSYVLKRKGKEKGKEASMRWEQWGAISWNLTFNFKPAELQRGGCQLWRKTIRKNKMDTCIRQEKPVLHLTSPI